LLSPTFVVPAASEYVFVDFDVAFDTEDDPLFNIQTYDGLILRIGDLTPGRVARGVAAEAFAEDFLTGAANFYPKHNSRQNGHHEHGRLRAGRRRDVQGRRERHRRADDVVEWAGDADHVEHEPGLAQHYRAVHELERSVQHVERGPGAADRELDDRVAVGDER